MPTVNNRGHLFWDPPSARAQSLPRANRGKGNSKGRHRCGIRRLDAEPYGVASTANIKIQRICPEPAASARSTATDAMGAA
jgi:hypothetical protein